MIPSGVVRGQKKPAHVSFPARLMKTRKAAGLSKHRLSLDSGLANDAVGNLESAARVPGIDTIERLSLTLSVSPCWLAFGMEQACPSESGLQCASMGQRLQVARQRAGLSARALATAAEISAPTVIRIEKGLFFPRLDTVEKLSKALKVSACWLAYGMGPQVAPSRRGASPAAAC